MVHPQSRSELRQQMDYIFKMCSEQRGIQELGWNLTAPLELVVTEPTPRQRNRIGHSHRVEMKDARFARNCNMTRTIISLHASTPMIQL
jgi:hypothetical protein